jgi:hypothetical protein
MRPLIIIGQVELLLVLLWQAHRWRARALAARHRKSLLAQRLREQATQADPLPATFPPPPAPVLLPPTSAHRSVTALSVADVGALLMLTRWALDRAAPGSTLHQAATRARVIAETAARDFGVDFPSRRGAT